MRGLIKEQSIILKMSWHLLIPHQIMKYLFEPEAISGVFNKIYSTVIYQVLLCARPWAGAWRHSEE